MTPTPKALDIHGQRFLLRTKQHGVMMENLPAQLHKTMQLIVSIKHSRDVVNTKDDVMVLLWPYKDAFIVFYHVHDNHISCVWAVLAYASLRLTRWIKAETLKPAIWLCRNIHCCTDSVLYCNSQPLLLYKMFQKYKSGSGSCMLTCDS